MAKIKATAREGGHISAKLDDGLKWRGLELPLKRFLRFKLCAKQYAGRFYGK